MKFNWRQLNVALPTMTEDQVRDLLHDEQRGDARPTHITRLHQRFTALRAARERRELADANDYRLPRNRHNESADSLEVG